MLQAAAVSQWIVKLAETASTANTPDDVVPAD
jgi:hypothetical protein